MKTRQLQLQIGLIYGVFMLGLAVIWYFWVLGSGLETIRTWHGFITGVGRLAGLLGAYFIITDFLLMARAPILERTLGRPLQTIVHKWAGYIAFSLIMLHFSLLTIGYAIVGRVDLITQFVIFFNSYADVDLAVIGVILLFAVVGTSIWFVRKNVDYETWYWIHLLSYIAILLAFFHQLNVGPDFIGQPVFVACWYFLYLALLAVVVYYRFTVPIWRSFRHDLRVDRIVPETHDIYSIYLKGRRLDQLTYQGGQFAIWRFLDEPRWSQGHPFSLSESPNSQSLRLTFKQSGDFTQDLPQVKPGTRVIMDGPYGIFTARAITQPKLLMIAGGIGLTPIIGMLKEAGQRSQDIAIIYAARTETDLALRRELEDYAKRLHIKLTYVVSNDPNYAGVKGLLTQDLIAKLVPDANEREVFLCGPPPMMMALTRALQALGVPRHLIHSEDFSF